MHLNDVADPNVYEILLFTNWLSFACHEQGILGHTHDER